MRKSTRWRIIKLAEEPFEPQAYSIIDATTGNFGIEICELRGELSTAQLIAAAPMMLNALKTAYPALIMAAHEARKADNFEAAQMWSETGEEVNKAILKAEEGKG